MGKKRTVNEYEKMIKVQEKHSLPISQNRYRIYFTIVQKDILIFYLEKAES